MREEAALRLTTPPGRAPARCAAETALRPTARPSESRQSPPCQRRRRQLCFPSMLALRQACHRRRVAPPRVGCAQPPRARRASYSMTVPYTLAGRLHRSLSCAIFVHVTFFTSSSCSTVRWNSILKLSPGSPSICQFKALPSSGPATESPLPTAARASAG